MENILLFAMISAAIGVILGVIALYTDSIVLVKIGVGVFGLAWVFVFVMSGILLKDVFAM